MNWQKLLGLIFCNFCWSGSYAVSKSLMGVYHPMEVTFLRYITGFIPLFLLISWGGQKSLFREWLKKISLADVRIVLIGLTTFFISPICQLTALKLSRASDASLMVALEPLATVIGAIFFLKEKPSWRLGVAIVLAIIGAGIITEVTWGKLRDFTDARLLGNSIFFVSLACEAAYSILAKPILSKRSPIMIIAGALFTGMVFIFFTNIALYGVGRMAGLTVLFSRMALSEFVAIAYLGITCTFIGYVYWISVLPDTPLSLMALTLYIQPVMGLVWGNALLGEEITQCTLLGGALILVSVWLGSRPAHKV